MTESVKTAYGYLKGKGYSDAAVAGILGNLTSESGDNLDPKIKHDFDKAQNRYTGIGIAGWRDPVPGKGRMTDLTNFAREKGADMYALKTQLDFLDHELKTKEFGVYKRLQEAKTPSEAALAFISFERPAGWTASNPAGGHNWSGRNSKAAKWYNTYSGSAPVEMQDVASTVQRNPRVGLNDVTPTNPYTVTEQRTVQQSLDREAAGFWGAAAESGWDASPVKWALQGLNKTEPDVNFRWRDNQELLKEVTKGVPQEHFSAFEAATSEGHARKIRERIDSQLDMNRRIAAGGWSAAGGALLGEMLEPVSLGASILVPEVAGVAKMGRVARVAVGAASAAAGNVALEMPRYLTKETASTSDVLWAAGAGLAIGGAFGAIRRNPATAAEAARVENVGKSLIRQQTAELDGSTTLTPQGSSAGAMANYGRESLHPDMDAWFSEGLEAPETALGGLRFDAVGGLKSSPSPVSRALGALGLDAVGNKDKSKVNVFAATEYQRRTHNGMMAQASKEYTVARDAFFKENEVPWAKRGEAEQTFRTQVSSFIRNTDPTREWSPAVAQMGTKLRSLQATYVDLLTNPGQLSGKTLEPVPGFAGLQKNENYLMRQVDHQKVFANTKAFGDKPVAQAFAKGIMGQNPEMDPKVAQKIATGYIKRLRELSAGVDLKGDRAASGEDLEAMKELLDDFGTLSPKEIDAVLDIFAPKKTDSGVSARAKRRQLYDENFAEKLTVTDRQDPRFGQTVEFRLMDLFEDDAMEVFENYSRQISGLLGLHQVRVANPKFTPDHIRPIDRDGIEVRDSQTRPDIVSKDGELNLTIKGDHMVLTKATLKGTNPDAGRELMEAAADYASQRGKRLVSDVRVDKATADLFNSLKGDFAVDFAQSALRKGKGVVNLERRDGKPVFEVRGEWTPPSPEKPELISGLAKDSDWDRAMERLAQSWDELAGNGSVSHDQRVKGLERDLANAQFLRDQILGRSDKFDQSTYGKALRRLRDYNFLRLMNNVGLAQVTEFFHATSSIGLKATMSAMPAFRTLIRNAKTGELDDVIARDIEYITNYGTDWVRGSLKSVLSDNGAQANAMKTGGLGERYDNAMEGAKRVSTVISGMAAINTALQRFAARGVYAKFAHMADGDAVNFDRLAQMGIDRDMASRIFAEIKANRTYLQGASGKMDLPRMNIERWQDQEAAAHFQMGVTRWAEYAVLANDPGAMSRIIGTWFGKTVFQFRSFVMGSWARHLLHNIHMKDWQTAFTFLFTGFGGALTHIAHSHLATAGRSDRQEELEKRLSWDKLILNGWARTSWASFMPMLIDTGVTLGGFDPVFTRVSGQATDAFLGNPSVGFVNDTRKGIAGLVQNSFGDNDMSQADARNIAKAFPYQNWIPFQALMSTMVRDLPEYEPKK